MSLAWYDWTGFAGVALVLLAFLLLQMRRLHGNKLVYQSMNALGALGVITSLLFGTFNLPALLMEFGWLAISVYGMAVTFGRGSVER
jgi:hypothetical protein